MPRSLATALLVGLFFFSGLAEGRTGQHDMKSFSVAAKKKTKKKKKQKKKKKKKKKLSTGIPAYDKILEHQAAMLEILLKNQNDCGKAASELKVYTDKNFGDYQKLAKQRDAAIASMSPEERQVFNKRVEEKMWQISQRYWDVVTGLDKRCPYNRVEIQISLRMFK
jgi:hypothetical protein